MTIAQIVPDIDGDDNPDVLVHAIMYDLTTWEIASQVIAKRGYDGSHLWEEAAAENSLMFAFPAGDLDGDGDVDVAVGTYGGRTIYALAKVENKAGTATGTGTVYFDSDPSTLRNLEAVPESELPPEGKPDLVFPHGFFSFNKRA